MHGKNYRQWKGQFYSKKFAPGAPNSKVARFTTGKSRPDYDDLFKLISEGKVQIRHNALEAARVAASKKVALIGEENFFLKVVTYPHLVLRENKMIATAGADRLQEGMRKAFGKPIGLAARVDIGDTVLELSLKAENFEKGKEAMKAASTKLPMKTRLEIVKLEKPAAAPAQPEAMPS
ncbi:MAG TPA: 50S ribosomal protein L16 [Nitrososphaerales archaeon]|nr:50S ribosomal protein L16 [Nitrososphaerales archaeon]